jgi:hypothetical protein
MGEREKFRGEHERQESVNRSDPPWPDPMPGRSRWEELPTKVNRGEEEWPPKPPAPLKESSE